MAACGAKPLVPTRLLPMQTRLSAGVRCISHMGKILLFFDECATLRLTRASVESPRDNNVMNKNLDFGRYIPELWREVYKETVWEQGKLP